MDVILSSASHHAMLFAYLAKRTIDAFGEAGKAAVTAGVRHYGEQRGAAWRCTQADGNPLDVENYLVYGEWEAFPGANGSSFPAICTGGTYGKPLLPVVYRNGVSVDCWSTEAITARM